MAHASGVYDTFVELWSGQSSGGGHIRPLLAPSRYKGAYGGRGSGKSHFFGELLVETCQAERGTSAVCIREAQRTLAQSSKRLIESKIAALGLGHQFRIYSDKIATPGDGIIIFRGMQHHTAESI